MQAIYQTAGEQAEDEKGQVGQGVQDPYFKWTGTQDQDRNRGERQRGDFIAEPAGRLPQPEAQEVGVAPEGPGRELPEDAPRCATQDARRVARRWY